MAQSTGRSADEIIDEQLDLLTAFVKNTVNLDDGGKPLDVRAFLENTRWAREQLDKFVSDKRNFLSDAKPSSATGANSMRGTSPAKKTRTAPEAQS